MGFFRHCLGNKTAWRVPGSFSRWPQGQSL